MFNIFFSENRAIYEIMGKTTVKPGRPQIIQYGACALHAGYLRLKYILFTFLLQQCLDESVSMLPYTCTHSLSCYKLMLRLAI